MNYLKLTLTILVTVSATTEIENEFEFQFESSVLMSMDVCPDLGRNESFGNRLKCDYNKTLIQRGFWIGSTKANTTVVGYCKFCNVNSHYYSDTFREYVPLTSDQCNSNRKGFLCSKCIEGTAPALNSRRFECIKCNPTKAFGYIVGGIFQSILLCGFMLIFYPASAGSMNSFVFFSQVVNTLQFDGDGIIPTNKVGKVAYAYNSIYGIWNMEFIDPILSTCLSYKKDTIDVVGLNSLLLLLFISPVFVASSIVYMCQKKCRSCDTILNSPGSLVASSLVLLFMQVSLAGFIFIRPTNMYNKDGYIEGKVLFYQGNLNYFKENHSVVYGILGVMMITCLIAFTLSMFLLRNVNGNTDASINRRDIRIYLNQFLNKCILSPFQGYFRSDERECTCNRLNIWKDCRWYAGWYFFLRLAFAATYVFSTNLLHQLIIQLVLCVVALVLSVVFRPYNLRIHNWFDAVILLILTVLYSLTLARYCLYVKYGSKAFSGLTLLEVIQCIVVFIPALSVLVLSNICMYRKISKYCQCRRTTQYPGEIAHLLPAHSINVSNLGCVSHHSLPGPDTGNTSGSKSPPKHSSITQISLSKVEHKK